MPMIDQHTQAEVAELVTELESAGQKAYYLRSAYYRCLFSGGENGAALADLRSQLEEVRNAADSLSQQAEDIDNELLELQDKAERRAERESRPASCEHCGQAFGFHDPSCIVVASWKALDAIPGRVPPACCLSGGYSQ